MYRRGDGSSPLSYSRDVADLLTLAAGADFTPFLCVELCGSLSVVWGREVPTLTWDCEVLRLLRRELRLLCWSCLTSSCVTWCCSRFTLGWADLRWPLTPVVSVEAVCGFSDSCFAVLRRIPSLRTCAPGSSVLCWVVMLYFGVEGRLFTTSFL